jgi:hypothetical protein
MKVPSLILFFYSLVSVKNIGFFSCDFLLEPLSTFYETFLFLTE